MTEQTNNWSIRPLTKPVIAVAGGFLLLIGAILLILPGPGIVLIAAGFSVLGVEYPWARRQQRRFRDWLRRRGW